MGFWKMNTAKQINRQRATPGARVWQRNYYERVVRSADELRRIRAYVAQNPARWATDALHTS
ncbi:MAG: hypothetical protein Rubg2KO_39070 [Rubricoccaceae bacterium]